MTKMYTFCIAFLTWILLISPYEVFSVDFEKQIAKFNFDEIVFAERMPGQDWPKSGHYYANFGRFAYDEDPLKEYDHDCRKVFGDGGRLCKLNIKTGELTVILDDPIGGIRDPHVHYDGGKILFSYRKGGELSFHLYEINVDGTGLTQLTEGPYNDIEPNDLPDGGIVFVSSRCNRWVNCWLTEVAVLYRCDGDGSNIRPLSSNNEHDNTPSVLPDGRILYTRWEYVDRSQVHYHHLWTINPDGTNQMTYFGNMTPGIVMIDAKPVVGTQKIIASFSPGHGRREHAGLVVIVDPSLGPDADIMVNTITEKATYRDPFPVSEDWYLVAEDRQILLMDEHGSTGVLYRIPDHESLKDLICHEPAPIRKRPRENIIPSKVSFSKDTGTVVLSNVYRGRSMEGVKPGDIKKLLVLESLPKPINFTGGMEPLSYGGTFTLERILGTIPVEEDGSAYAELPAMRSLFFVALDENGLSVKRMQSFFTLQPGETVSCAGCHEPRRFTLSFEREDPPIALSRVPNRVEPYRDLPDVIDFPRDIQPIFDHHCLACHDYDKRDGAVILTGDRGPYYKHSYFTLFAHNQVVDGRNLPQSSLAPRTIGSSASPLMQKIDGSHHQVKVAKQERDLIRLWIDTGAPAAGTYAALGSGMFGGYWANRLDRRDMEWDSTEAAIAAQERRCSECHENEMALPSSPSDDLGMQPWIPLKPDDPRRTFSRHLLFNLTRPEKSLILLSPLAQNAGGYAIDEKGESIKHHPIIFKDTSDPDYQTMLNAIQEAKEHLDQIKRFDMAGFRPRPEYIREMQRYGIIPKSLFKDDAVDSYAADQAYWRSLWYQPNSGKNG